jgi:hypothetical protein
MKPIYFFDKKKSKMLDNNGIENPVLIYQSIDQVIWKCYAMYGQLPVLINTGKLTGTPLHASL